MNNIVPNESYELTTLKDYIKCFKYYSSVSNSNSQDYTIFPEGYFEIIFQFGKEISYKNSSTKNWKRLPKAFIGGLHNKSFKIRTYNNSQFFSVCFRRGKAKYFLPNELSFYKNQSISIYDIWGKAGFKLINQLSSEKNNSLRVNLIARFLLTKLEKKDSAIENSLHFIIKKKGIISIRHLADFANLSVSQYRNRFCKEIGISPKEFTRIIRINSLISEYPKIKSTNPLTEIAHQYEYFDQSHFVKDFKSLTSYTPKKYFHSFNIR